MISWLLAVAVAAVLAAAAYGWHAGQLRARVLPLLALRWAALAVLLALVLDAPAGAAGGVRSLVALDASASWLRGGDTALWKDAVARARALRPDTLLLMGDSVRAVPRAGAPRLPADNSSRVRELSERALAAGRPVILITDGELDDPAAARALPAGSRIEVVPHPATIDAAVVTIEAPRAVVAGDTFDIRVAVRSGARATPAGTLAVATNGRVLATTALAPMPPRTDRSLSVRVPFGEAPGPAVLSAVVTVGGDAARRNDTASVAVDVARAAGAVLASTSPDFDARFLLPVLRGAVALPTRAYFRVAPGQWRQDGGLAPVSEGAVRAALREAPLAIIHGDTAYFGAPRTATTGSLLLMAPPPDSTGEWYALGAPPSPVSDALAAIAWDSLPPIALAERSPTGEWDALDVALARQFAHRVAIAGSGGARRVVVVAAAGFWRWAFRGGSSADAYTALWGSIFDWLTAERPDPRAAFPAEGLVREGEPIRWRRGAGADSVVTVRLQRRGTAGEDTIRLRFPGGVTVAESSPLPAGVYLVHVAGGSAVLAVNVTRELLPRAPTVGSGAVSGRVASGEAPRLRSVHWILALPLLFLCAEWLLRRKQGLR